MLRATDSMFIVYRAAGTQAHWASPSNALIPVAIQHLHLCQRAERVGVPARLLSRAPDAG
jgi:hypothetical protein